MKERSRAVNPASLRGLAVLAIAVVLGLALLAGTDDVSLSTEARSDRAAATTTTAAGGTTLPDAARTSSTTAPQPGQPARPPAEVQVIVLNGSGGLARGVAGASTDKLDGLGYETVEPGNSPARDASVVLHADGLEADAAAVKEALGLPGTIEPIGELPTPAAQGADLVVVLGRDAADLPGAEPGTSATTETTASTPTTAGPAPGSTPTTATTAAAGGSTGDGGGELDDGDGLTTTTSAEG